VPTVVAHPRRTSGSAVKEEEGKSDSKKIIPDFQKESRRNFEKQQAFQEMYDRIFPPISQDLKKKKFLLESQQIIHS